MIVFQEYVLLPELISFLGVLFFMHWGFLSHDSCPLIHVQERRAAVLTTASSWYFPWYGKPASVQGPRKLLWRTSHINQAPPHTHLFAHQLPQKRIAGPLLLGAQRQEEGPEEHMGRELRPSPSLDSEPAAARLRGDAWLTSWRRGSGGPTAPQCQLQVPPAGTCCLQLLSLSAVLWYKTHGVFLALCWWLWVWVASLCWL